MLSQGEKERREKLRAEKPLAYAKVMEYEKQLAKGKSIAMLQINPSYDCNFSCSHCSISCFRKQKKRIITLDHIKDLCNQADEYGLAQIDLTGGEPLLFNNLAGILTAFGTQRFYLSLATNGWLMSREKAIWLKEMGVDRILLSLDNLNEEEHDKFRNKPGSYKKAIAAMGYVKDAGLDLKITSVITHERARSDELKDFEKFVSDKGARVEALPPRLVGEWEGRYDLLLTDDDFKYLQDTYHMQFHTSSHFGIHMGCVAVKKTIVVTAFGDVMPCIWMYYSLGNILETPFKDIVAKGMRYFGKFHPLCRLAEDKKFLEMYNKSIQGRTLPIAIEEVL